MIGGAVIAMFIGMIVNHFLNSKSVFAAGTKFTSKKIFPWFILGFLAMSIVASIFPIPAAVVSVTKKASKFMMVCALAAIGVNTSFKDMKKAGINQ